MKESIKDIENIISNLKDKTIYEKLHADVPDEITTYRVNKLYDDISDITENIKKCIENDILENDKTIVKIDHQLSFLLENILRKDLDNAIYSKEELEQDSSYINLNLLLRRKIKANIDNQQGILRTLDYDINLITQSIDDIKKRTSDISIFIQKIEETKNLFKEAEKEIEAKQLSISTFSTNLDEYKTNIDELEKKAKEVIAKEETINKLISEAETALELKSAQGVSAAFAAQYRVIQTRSKLWKFNGWLLGAAIFALGAIAITIWIALSQSNSNSNNLTEKLAAIPNATIPTEYWVSMLVARITAVAILLAGATFCAKQYIKQQNIAEDYAYKAVLAKSIVAFTEEIKSHDPSKAGEYLTKVLDEIHKDPLRGRDNKEDSNVGIDLQELIKNLMDKIPTNKQG